jgi:hypothetical protein
MNVTDKLYTEWAWRTKNGTPDMNNPEDKAILESLLKELGAADGQITKDEVINAIKIGEFTPQQLKNILSGISGVAYKQEVMDYLNKKGKAVTSISKQIYNEFVENGDIQKFHAYITGTPITYDGLGASGNLKTAFEKFISAETISYLLNTKPSMGNIATGKGEVLLCTLVGDVHGDPIHGDVGVGKKGIEVKNGGAIPMGQKAEFSKATAGVMIADAIKEISSLVGQQLEVQTKGNRPFHRLNKILEAVATVDSSKVDSAIDIMDSIIKRLYRGIDFTDFNLSSFKSGNTIDADKLEVVFGKKVIDLYVILDKFEEVLFLDDSSGSFIKIAADALSDLAGTKIKVQMKDGLPRWWYVF